MALSHREPGIVPQLAGRPWETASLDLQEYLQRLQFSGEGLPSSEAIEAITPVVGAQSEFLAWVLLTFKRYW